MQTYHIVITAPAESDMGEIYTYIAQMLKEPGSAARIYRAIQEAIFSLSTMPRRFQVVKESPYADLGVRKLFVENYTVFYVVEEDTVTVLRVLYNRREWQSIL